jgi:hypothetical protein
VYRAATSDASLANARIDSRRTKKKAKRKRRFAFPARVHTEARVRTEGCVSAV